MESIVIGPVSCGTVNGNAYKIDVIYFEGTVLISLQEKFKQIGIIIKFDMFFSAKDFTGPCIKIFLPTNFYELNNITIKSQ